MRRIDGEARGPAQYQYCKGRSSSMRNDQKVRPGIAAANGHDALV